jgi:soluble lytic murein transglycosylase
VKIFLCCFFGILPLLSCAAEPALLKKDAAELLAREGVSGKQSQKLMDLYPSVPFYAGLLAEPEDPRRAHELFEAVLKSKSPVLRDEASKKLIIPVLEDPALAARVLRLTRRNDNSPVELTLRCAALYTLGGFSDARQLSEYTDQTAWDRIIVLLTVQSETAQPVPDFFLTEPVDTAYTWAWEAVSHSFDQPVVSAIAGRIAASKRSYQEGLVLFRQVLEQDSSLFLQYPEVLFDLGRCFQYVNPAQGLALFLEWDELVQSNSTVAPAVRFYLRYFAGRMERYRVHYANAIEHFTKAHAWVADMAQDDLCTWYLLDTAIQDNPEKSVDLFAHYAPVWHDPDYFSDVLGSLCWRFVTQQKWRTLLTLFAGIRFYADPTISAQYAYILGRAVAEEQLSPEDAAIVLAMTDTSKGAVSQALFDIAFSEQRASFYYRASSARYLGKAVLLPEEHAMPEKVTALLKTPEQEFLVDFLEYGAGKHAFAYLKSRADSLSVAELRSLAQALAEYHFYGDSIRTVLLYRNRADYENTYHDMLLLYPRPFQDIVEKHARETGIPAEVLFGLIRTESVFEPAAISHAGALGLSQLMPATAEEEARRIAKQGGPNYAAEGSIDVFNPAVNIHIGSSYLQYLIPLVENRSFALMAYNGGIGRVRRWRTASPQLPADLFVETVELIETREYGKRVLGAAAVYGYLYYAKSMEMVINESLP